jgi:hypothetical protein
VFSAWDVPRSYKEDNWGDQVSSVWGSVKKRSRWKGAAVQRGLEPGSRELTIVRSPYQTIIIEDTADWKRLSMIL